MGRSYIVKGNRRNMLQWRGSNIFAVETPRLVICSIHLSRIYMTLSVFVFGSISCLSQCLGCLYFRCQSQTKISFLHLCPFYLFLLCLSGISCDVSEVDKYFLIVLFVFFFVVLLLSFGFCLRCSGCQRQKTLICLCVCGFYPFLFSSLWFWLWCSRCQRRTNIALHKILLTAILSVSTVRIFAQAKMFCADIRTLDTISTFDFFGIFGIFAPVEMFWADMCTQLQVI